MSLIDAYMTKCVWLEPYAVDDGEGGSVITWREGSLFNAAATLSSSTKRTNADKAEAANIYNVTVYQPLLLPFHGVFRRVKDGKVFRIISDGADRKTPETSPLNLRRATAEEWEVSA